MVKRGWHTAFFVLVLLYSRSVAGQDVARDVSAEDLVVVETTHYRIELNKRGAVVDAWSFLPGSVSDADGERRRYSAQSREPVVLLDVSNGPARSGHYFDFGVPDSVSPDWAEGARTAQYELQRADSEPAAILTFTWTSDNGVLSIAKEYSFPDNGLESTLAVTLTNHGAETVRFDRPAAGGIALQLPFRFGEHLTHETKGEDAAERARSVGSVDRNGWIALLDSYFAMIVRPETSSPANPWQESIAVEEGFDYGVIELVSQPFSLEPGEARTFAFSIYLGPKADDVLEEYGYETGDLTAYWPVFGQFCALMSFVLESLQRLFGSWVAAIAFLAVVIRVLTFPLSRYGARRQQELIAAQRGVQPLIAELKEKYKGDALKMHEELIKLHKEHGLTFRANLAGALPLMVQLPILVALYQVLINMYELRGLSFLWIDDLSMPDRLFSWGFAIPWLGSHFNLLPAIMFASNMYMAWAIFNRAGGDAEGQQKKAGSSIFVMPIAMLLLFYPFPAGPMIYWTTSNVLQAVEQRFYR